jgi:hypothetical protein
MVTVTAKEDCNVLANGQSVTLAKGDTAEMTPEEAAGYANLGLVEVSSGGKSGGNPEGSDGGPGGPAIPRRR